MQKPSERIKEILNERCGGDFIELPVAIMYYLDEEHEKERIYKNPYNESTNQESTEK